MVAPIFRFRNVKVRLTTTSPTFIYGVVTYDSLQADKTLADGVSPSEVSAVMLTVQVSNASASTVAVSAFVQNLPSASTFDTVNNRCLVKEYPLVAKNAFDPLSGNLVMSEGDQVWMQASAANQCDVVVSILEIANATAT
jgi:hypothetical protein